MEPPKIWREKRERYLATGIICLDCNEKSFPKSNYCSKCSGSNIEEYKIAKTGRVMFFTKITQASQGMLSYAPYALGLIELDDGIKVTGQITGCQFEEIQDDMKVRMVFRILSRDDEEGLIRYGFKFAPL